jgi:hypothetical protein
MAQQMGLHRDPSDSAYSPFIIEIRRRMWNYLNILDGFAMLNYGCESCLAALPRNAEEEFWLASRFIKPSNVPPEVSGFTNMSLATIRGMLANLTRDVANDLQLQGTRDTFTDHEARINAAKTAIDETYLPPSTPNSPSPAPWWKPQSRPSGSASASTS